MFLKWAKQGILGVLADNLTSQNNNTFRSAHSCGFNELDDHTSFLAGDPKESKNFPSV
jgi:hypothetical protein